MAKDALGRAARLEILTAAVAEFDPLPFDAAAASRYGTLVALTVAAKRDPRPRRPGLMIAAIASAHDLPLYTRNTADFRGLESAVEVIGVWRGRLSRAGPPSGWRRRPGRPPGRRGWRPRRAGRPAAGCRWRGRRRCRRSRRGSRPGRWGRGRSPRRCRGCRTGTEVGAPGDAVAGAAAGPQVGLLRVHAGLRVPGAVAEQPQPGSAERGDGAGPQVGADAAGVGEGEEGVVVDDGAVAAGVDLGVDRVDRSEQVIAWSTRWLPRSYRVPPTSAGSASSRQPALGFGRNRSNRDSNRCTRPSAPSSTRRRTVRKSPSQRRFWKTESSVPDCSASSHRASASSAVAASGLSTTVARPAARAARPSGTWVRLGEAITTRSRVSASASSWAGVSTARAPGCSWRSWARRSGLAVTTASSCSPGVVAISGAWKAEPARP